MTNIEMDTAAAVDMTEVNMEEMALANGGTFTPNTYRKSAYHRVGISTSYHVFDKDEFIFMGRSITYDQANEIVFLGHQVSKAMNEGMHGKDQVGYSEPAFIRGLNSQLYLKYGFAWDGAPGVSF